MGKTTFAEDSSYAFVPMASVGAADGSIDVSTKRPYAEVKKGFTSFQSGDVLFAKITPCMENGKMAVVPDLENHYGFGSTEFHVIRPKAGIDPKYVYYFVSCSGFRREAGHNMTGAVGQKRVPTDFLKQRLIPLPPTPEDQKRIVAEIEKQFSRLDEAIASLKRIHANLKRYKAAVLKAAVEGKLTEQWRKDHPVVEPADQLLKRILAERRAKWEAEELAKIKAKGTKPKDDSWKKKYKEPAGPDSTNLPELPEGWVWVSAYTVCIITSGYAFKSNEFTDSGTPAIKIANVSYGRFLWKQQEYLPDGFVDSYKDFQVQPGEILLALTRPITVDTVKACVYPLDAPIALLNQRVASLKPFHGYEKNLLLYLMQSEPFKIQIKSGLTETLQPNLSPLDLQKFSVPLPPETEQLEIVAEIDRRLSVSEELETTVETNLKRAERLRQTILQRAFSGGLV